MEKHPLDNYLVLLRDYELEYWKLWNKRSLAGMEAFHEIGILSSRIEELKKATPLKPREFDVFKNKVQIELERFFAENPKPFDIYKCECTETEIRLRKRSDNYSYVAKQCLKCGRVVGGHLSKAKISNLNQLIAFDEELGNAERTLLKEWYAKRNAISDTLFIEGDKPPEFNAEEFRIEYDKANPEPYDPLECEHIEQKPTTREYKNGDMAIVSQCITCGVHVKAISKASVQNINDLDKFDEVKYRGICNMHNKWRSDRYRAEREADNKFTQAVNEDIKAGKYKFVVNSTYRRYYESEEWHRTRDRILDRDKNLCRSCGKIATHVHHMTYERLGKENDYDLISLCNECHKEVHRRQDLFSSGNYHLTHTEICSLSDWGFVIANLCLSGEHYIYCRLLEHIPVTMRSKPDDSRYSDMAYNESTLQKITRMCNYDEILEIYFDNKNCINELLVYTRNVSGDVSIDDEEGMPVNIRFIVNETFKKQDYEFLKVYI